MSDITTEVIKKKKTISWVLAPFTSVALELAKQKTKTRYQKMSLLFSMISPSIDHKKWIFGLRRKSGFQIFLDFVRIWRRRHFVY